MTRLSGITLGGVSMHNTPTGKLTPTLGAFTVPAKILGDAPFTLTPPTSTSDGTWSYTSSNTSVATISGSTVTIVTNGDSTITATQAETATYNSASTDAPLAVSLPPYTAALAQVAVTSGVYNTAAYFNDTFFLYASSGSTTVNSIPYSTNNGTSFQLGAVNTGIPPGIINATTDGTTLVLVRNSGGPAIQTIFYTTDGFNYGTYNSPSAITPRSIAYGAGRFVAVSTDTKMLSSTDGVNWTYNATGMLAGSWVDIVYANGIFMACKSVTATNNVATSADGINWSYQTLPTSASLRNVIYGNGMWIATQSGAASTQYWYSTDNGVNWTEGAFPIAVLVQDGIFLNDTFVMPSSASGASVLYSTTGLSGSWTSKTATPASSILSISQCAVSATAAIIPTGGTKSYVLRSI